MANHPNRRISAQCKRLAKRLGCTLDMERPNGHWLVNIYLPDGMQVQGNRGLDVLSHNVEKTDDVWPGVLVDLQTLDDGGMEPLQED